MANKVIIKTRKAPDFSGVPGELVAALDADLQFTKTGRISPYDVLLDKLSVATDEAIAAGKPLPGLKFGDVKARASLTVRAKKKGIRVAFAEREGTLFVRIEGRVDAIEKRALEIKKILAGGTASSAMVAQKLRTGGDENADGAGVEVMLTKMMRTGEVIRQEGGTWKLAPKKAA